LSITEAKPFGGERHAPGLQLELGQPGLARATGFKGQILLAQALLLTHTPEQRP
jgi:hypothetical protein